MAQSVIKLDKVVMPLQAFGLGDHIFTISLMRDFIDEGYDVVYPVKPQFVEGNNRAYPQITFISDAFIKESIFNIRTDCVIDGVRILPIRFAEHIMGRPYKYHMISKYQMFGKDWRMWRRSAYPVRYKEREYALCRSLGISDGERYNLVLKRFGSDSKHIANIEASNGLRNVEMREVGGFSLFDWCGIIENAENIYSVSTSTLYLYEILDLKAKEIHLYPRKPIEHNFDYVSFLFTKPYILH